MKKLFFLLICCGCGGESSSVAVSAGNNADISVSSSGDRGSTQIAPEYTTHIVKVWYHKNKVSTSKSIRTRRRKDGFWSDWEPVPYSLYNTVEDLVNKEFPKYQILKINLHTTEWGDRSMTVFLGNRYEV